MSGASIAGEVAAGLAEVGQETGTGTPLKALLIRTSEPDRSTTPPTPGEAAAYLFAAMQTKFSFSEMQSGSVQEGDVKFLLEAGPTAPRNDDKIKVGNTRYEIERFEAVAPGGVPLMWKIHARGGVRDENTYPLTG